MISNTDGIEVHRALLKEILDRVPGNPVFEKLLNFYKEIFLKNPDLIVCMSRKSWCVIHLFLPLLENEGIVVDRKKLTHDRMVHPWFAELDHNKHSKIKVFVIDDTFQTGRAIDDCILRLKWVYNVDEKNLTVAVFAMTDDEKNNYNRRRIDIKENSYTAYDSHSRGKLPLKVNWNGGEVFYIKDDVSVFSYSFVEAIHACSEPYVGYIPAFRLPIKVVQDFLGADRGKDIEPDSKSAIRIPGYLEQDDLRAPLNDPDKIGYYNITSRQMRESDIDAFYFSLPCLDFNNIDMPFLPTSDALSVAALRFYLNRKTGIALIVPYLSLKDCYADADIVKMFPEKLQPLMNYINTTENWNDKEEHIAAYRLLRYASGYLWGKHVFQRWFNCEVKEENIASRGGICSDTFFDWLNSSSAVQDLTYIWSFFAPEMNNVVKETRTLLEPDSKTSLEEIIHHDIPEDEADFGKVIIQSLSVSPPDDYFNTISIMFRNILDQEQKILDEYTHKGKEEFSLPSPFRGLPLHTFFDLLLLKFPELKTRRDVLTTVTLMLCDMGVAVTQLYQRGNIIGTVLFNGEQSCHALAPIAPEYAYFLSEFPELVGQFNKEQRQEKFEMAKTEIRKYFEDEINQGKGRHLSLEELMSPLEDIRTIVVDAPNQDFIAYSVLPRGSFFDCSELFFTDLREKLNA
ncbi:MAG: phosphoribosyltransferase [Clostridiales bacterium]|jgi:hypothetical protein|nr:phosphoribosyltransferase [Clostridiales bacterium]